MITYLTKDGDVLDWICWKHYGTTNVFEQVLAANPNVTDYELHAGIIIKLPYISSIKNKKQEIKLWD